jgi:hypothetical protein
MKEHSERNKKELKMNELVLLFREWERVGTMIKILLSKLK